MRFLSVVGTEWLFWLGFAMWAMSGGLLVHARDHRRRAETALSEARELLQQIQKAIHERDRYTRGGGDGPSLTFHAPDWNKP